MTHAQIATALADVAKAAGWQIAIVTEGSDVIGVVLSAADTMQDLAPYGYDFSLLAVADRSPNA